MFQLLLNGFVLGLVASPTCPSNAEEIRIGTRYGFPSALLVGLGAVIGDALVLLIIWLGIYPLIQRYQVASISLWFLGAMVLAYIAWGIFKDLATVISIEKVNEQEKPALNTLLRAFWIGLSITTFNPFTALWWLGLLGPTFALHKTIPMPFVIAVLIGSLAWFVALAIILKVARYWLTQRLRQGIFLLSGIVVMGYAIFFLGKALALIFQ